MNVSSTSGVTAPHVGLTGTFSQKTEKALWSQVATNLASNNLAGAQTAFAKIAQNYRANNPAGSTSTPVTGAVSSDVEQFAAALKTGDLSTAQTSFATLQQAYQATLPTSDAASTAATSSSSISVLA